MDDKTVRIEQIDKELEELGELQSKQDTIAYIVISGIAANIGVGVFIAGLANMNLLALMIPCVALGILLFIAGLSFVFVNISRLSELVEKNNRIETLQKEKEKLQETEAKKNSTIGQNESDEDILLRLLSDGKITVDEYKKLSKK